MKKLTNTVQCQTSFLLQRIMKRLIRFVAHLAAIFDKTVACAIFAFAIITIPCLVESFQVVLRDKGTESNLCSFVIDNVSIENVENGVVIFSGEVIEPVFAKESLGFDKSSPEFTSSDIKLKPPVSKNSRIVGNKPTDGCSDKSDYSIMHRCLRKVASIVIGIFGGLVCLYSILFILDTDNIKYLSRELYGELVFFFKKKFSRSTKL